MNINKLILCIGIFITFYSCELEQQPKDDIEQPKNSVIIEVVQNQEELEEDKSDELNIDIGKHLSAYKKLKANISKEKNRIKKRNDIELEDKINLAQSYIFETLVDSIFPYWIGTKWDFSGYTEKPRDGEVACGYFVSTTLRDVGFRLNRYKVAQKGATDIIFQLCDHESIKKVATFQQFKKVLKEVKNDEMLIVGLSSHVGFIFKRNDASYFAHSNYIDRAGVMIEPIQESDALKSSHIYVLGNLTMNKEITENWLE